MWNSISQFFKKTKEFSNGKTILVVDDMEINRRIPESVFKKRGYNVVLADNGVNGVTQAQRHVPDLIILDLDLPDVKGPEICELLKASQTTANIPVIFLTSQDTPENVMDCFEKGAEIFLTKPIDTAELIAQVESTLRDRDAGKID